MKEEEFQALTDQQKQNESFKAITILDIATSTGRGADVSPSDMKAALTVFSFVAKNMYTPPEPETKQPNQDQDEPPISKK